MKALLISDNENITSPLDSYLKQNGYDTIIYTWLLKALDNVEEIKPDLIILCAEEYPRHWKTLVQYSKSSIGSQNVKIILIISDKFNKDDEEKAVLLGVSGFLKSVEQNELQNVIPKIQNKEISPSSTPSSIEDSEEILFNHPSTDKFVSGKIIEVKDEMIVFEFDCNSDLDDLFVGDYIKSITFYRNSECIHYSGYVNSINQDTKSVILELVDFNEKKY